eukprot:scaffold10550_cov271-Chaetoceros_neogracile.AAC.27
MALEIGGWSLEEAKGEGRRAKRRSVKDELEGTTAGANQSPSDLGMINEEKNRRRNTKTIIIIFI